MFVITSLNDTPLKPAGNSTAEFGFVTVNFRKDTPFLAMIGLSKAFVTVGCSMTDKVATAGSGLV